MTRVPQRIIVWRGIRGSPLARKNSTRTVIASGK